MIISNVDSFRDGGTLVFFTNKGNIYQDFRIGSVEAGTLWFGYPEKPGSVKLTPEEVSEFWEELHTFNIIIDAYLQKSLIALRTLYTAPQKKISITDTVCSCGKYGFWKSGGGLGKDVTECGHCGRTWPAYIVLRETL